VSPASRRLTACVILAFGCVSTMNALASSVSPEYDPAKVRVLPRADMRLLPFSLRQVRLMDGPFKDAMDRDVHYLLSLEPDRLLHRFRLYAGLEPKAPIYGGWETGGVSGHTLGHYLSACSMGYAATGDGRLRERVEYIVGELALCQSKHPDGYVGAIPEADRIFREVSEGIIHSQGFDLNGGWVPWYTLHKLFAGLIDSYLYCDNREALSIAKTLGDWAIRTTFSLTNDQWQTMLACEHGGMNEAMANLYAITGQRKYLDLARKFHHKRVLGPLELREDRLAGLHGNTQIPKVIGNAREYELTGEQGYRTIASFFWDRVVNHHSYVIGGHSLGEHFGQPDKLNDRLGTTTAETCNTYNMLKLTKHLICLDPRPERADFYERALYNQILASQDPDSGMMCYYVPLQPGYFKPYSTPFDSFWCCVGTGIENHVRYGESIYFQDAEGLYVNLFIASKLSWPERGVRVTQETRFPDEGATRLTLSCDQPVEFALRIRCPGWVKGSMTVAINQQNEDNGLKPIVRGGYVTLRREWRDGDHVDVRIPMNLRTEPMPDNPNRVALLYGPIVLAGDLGPEDLGVGPEGEPAEPRVPVFVTEGKALEDRVVPVSGEPLTFRTDGIGKPEDVTLIPFYRMHHRRYSVYWDLFSADEWARREAEYRVEQQRLAELTARTVDVMRIGEMQPERDHNLRGESTGAGDFGGRKWRHAVDGGWFSFEVGVLPDRPVDLVLTYWGSDSGGREFDILVDGVKIATQMLDNSKPGRFFDVIHELPEDLTRGKDKVTVRLQAHPHRTAGGLFGARTVKR